MNFKFSLGSVSIFGELCVKQVAPLVRTGPIQRLSLAAEIFPRLAMPTASPLFHEDSSACYTKPEPSGDCEEEYSMYEDTLMYSMMGSEAILAPIHGTSLNSVPGLILHTLNNPVVTPGHDDQLYVNAAGGATSASMKSLTLFSQDDTAHDGWLKKLPAHWSTSDTIDWLFDVAKCCGIRHENLNVAAFNTLTGGDLIHMSKEDFISRDPNYGDRIHRAFQDYFSNLHNQFDRTSSLPDHRHDNSAHQTLHTAREAENAFSTISLADFNLTFPDAPEDRLQPSVGHHQESLSLHYHTGGQSVLSTLSAQHLVGVDLQFCNEHSDPLSSPVTNQVLRVPHHEQYDDPGCQVAALHCENLHQMSSAYGSPKANGQGEIEISPRHQQRHQNRIDPLGAYQDKDSLALPYENPNLEGFNPEYYRDCQSTGGTPSPSESEDRMITDLPKKVGRPPKRDRSKSKKPDKGFGRLWEFIRDLLHNPKYCPSMVRWENVDEGIFRIVKSEQLAGLWGTIKNNPRMTYEKLSRAMRYYYKSRVFLPVLGRRLVYKFGPNAVHWRPADPNFEQLNAESSM